MKTLLRRAGKSLLVAGCLWHMAAIAIYATPYAGDNDPLQPVHDLARYVTPYLLITSQWQQWNLFSPDPLRRVTSYVIEGQVRGGTWKAFRDLHAGAFPWWRHAAQFKMLGSILDGNTRSELQHRMAEQYLQLECDRLELPDGMPLRLLYRTYVIPATDETMPVAWWQDFTPEETTEIGHETACDSTMRDPAHEL